MNLCKQVADEFPEALGFSFLEGNNACDIHFEPGAVPSKAGWVTHMPAGWTGTGEISSVALTHMRCIISEDFNFCEVPSYTGFQCFTKTAPPSPGIFSQGQICNKDSKERILSKRLFRR